MKVSQLIPAEHICIGWPSSNIPQSKSKRELIKCIVQFLCQKNNIPKKNYSNIIEQVIEREKSMTTAIGHGFAIPHASLDEIEKPTGACVILSEGIDFEAIDRENVHIIILVLLPKKHYTKNIQILNNIVELTNHDDIRDKWMHMKSAEDIWKDINRLENMDKSH